MKIPPMMASATVGLVAGYVGSMIDPSPKRTGLVTIGELGLAGLGVAMKSPAVTGIGAGAAVGGLIGLAVNAASNDARAGAASVH